MIPTLSFAIASLSGFAANSIMGGVSGLAGAGMSAAASEVAQGNMSHGVVRANMMNMNKYDANLGLNQGTTNTLSKKHSSEGAIVNGNTLHNYEKEMEEKLDLKSDKNINENIKQVNLENSVNEKFGYFGQKGYHLLDGTFIQRGFKQEDYNVNTMTIANDGKGGTRLITTLGHETQLNGPGIGTTKYSDNSIASGEAARYQKDLHSDLTANQNALAQAEANGDYAEVERLKRTIVAQENYLAGTSDEYLNRQTEYSGKLVSAAAKKGFSRNNNYSTQEQEAMQKLEALIKSDGYQKGTNEQKASMLNDYFNTSLGFDIGGSAGQRRIDDKNATDTINKDLGKEGDYSRKQSASTKKGVLDFIANQFGISVDISGGEQTSTSYETSTNLAKTISEMSNSTLQDTFAKINTHMSGEGTTRGNDFNMNTFRTNMEYGYNQYINGTITEQEFFSNYAPRNAQEAETYFNNQKLGKVRGVKGNNPSKKNVNYDGVTRDNLSKTGAEMRWED